MSRVFGVTLTCPTCGAEMRIIAVITEDEPIHKILNHLKSRKIDPRAGPFEEQAADSQRTALLHRPGKTHPYLTEISLTEPQKTCYYSRQREAEL